MKVLGTVAIFICLALATTIIHARAQSVGSTHAMFGGIGGLGGSSHVSGGGFGRYYYGTDTRAACALYYRRYGKLCGRPVIQRPVKLNPRSQRPSLSYSGACGSVCQSKCQASWRALGFRSVNACVARWAMLIAEGTSRTCETAIIANGMRPVRGC